MDTQKKFPTKWVNSLRELLNDDYGIPMEETEELPEIITDSIICKIFSLGRNWAVTLNGKVYLTPLFFKRQEEDKAKYGTMDFSKSDVEGYAKDVQNQYNTIMQMKFR